MKGVITLVVFLAVAVFVGSMFYGRTLTQDIGHQLAVAWGSPTEETIQFQLGVGMQVPMRDPPERNSRGVALWGPWVEAHFQLRDAGGKNVPLAKMGTSALMLDDRAAGAPEFVLYADLKKGTAYTCEYVPIVGEGKRYRSEFTVPAEPEEVRRYLFEFVPE